MRRCSWYFVVLLGGLLLNFPAASQKMSFVDAEGRGDGTTRIDATQNALIMAIGQVNRAQLAAQMSSQLKAITVKRYLILKHGVAGNRLTTIGWGEERLKMPLHPRDASNRRVENTVIPTAETKLLPSQSKSRRKW